MMQAVRGIYRGGIVELLENPEVTEGAEVVVTFLGAVGSSRTGALETVETVEAGQLLEDFEPIVPMKSIRLSDLVLEGRE